MWLYDSVVDHDVIAFDQAVIHLIDTKVGGQIRPLDEGKIYVDGEDFDLLPSVGPGFVLTSDGSITQVVEEVIAGSHSIKGSYSGPDSYTPYLRTNRTTLALAPEYTYRFTFDYRILSTPDQGFEVLFYSPTGGSEGSWLPSVITTGQTGDSGTVTLTSILDNHIDYEARWNVIGTGAIAIDNIQITNLTTGETTATEDAE